MAGGFTVEGNGLRSLSSDLRAAPSALAPKINAVVFKGALNIKKAMREDMQASRHFKGITRAIDFDMIDEANAVSADIGPTTDPGSAGNLANIAYFGGARGGGTVRDPQAALDDEAPKFEKALGDVLGGLL